jgi:aspartyl-tRNA(Asn)/glutamyl-tRNA(Gln) amidotransferase subunit C
MSITPNDLQKLSQLAKLDINNTRTHELTDSLNSVIDMVAQIQQINTHDISPLLNPLDATQILRADDVNNTNNQDAIESFAPNYEQGLFLVPKVIE